MPSARGEMMKKAKTEERGVGKKKGKMAGEPNGKKR